MGSDKWVCEVNHILFAITMFKRQEIYMILSVSWYASRCTDQLKVLFDKQPNTSR